MTLSGKRAFVTGGGTGIGAAIALQLAEAGADVVITGRREEPLIETAAKSSKIAWHVMDASDETSIINAMTAADDIDIMVANAGIADTSPVAKITMDHWRKVFATNVEGVMVCTREAVRQMVPRGWGRIIIGSSVAGLKGAPYIGAYSASKHAVLGLMKSAADETMTKGVTVNASCPAYVLTELVQKGIDNIVEKTELKQRFANLRSTCCFWLSGSPGKRR